MPTKNAGKNNDKKMLGIAASLIDDETKDAGVVLIAKIVGGRTIGVCRVNKLNEDQLTQILARALRGHVSPGVLTRAAILMM